MSLQTTHPLKNEPKRNPHTASGEQKSLLAGPGSGPRRQLRGNDYARNPARLYSHFAVHDAGNPTAQADAGTQTANTVQPDAHAPFSPRSVYG